MSSNQSGPVSIFVTNSDGSISNSVTFAYTTTIANAPTVSALAPSQGPTTGGTRVSVGGSNFSAGDSVVLSGPNIFSPAGDDCSDGQPLCSNNQCVLSAARGTCTISGTPGNTVFSFGGSGQLEILTPNVGTNGAGPADVFVRTSTGVPSNIVQYSYTSPQSLLPPTITGTGNASFAGDGCCNQGWGLVIFGKNFRKCSSILVVLGSGDGGVHEILPTPDVSDCGIRRGTTNLESPRERLQSLLPPDGMTIRCDQRHDLVPLRKIGNNLYQHDQICYFGAPAGYCPQTAMLIPNGGDPADVTSGGAVTWISESEIRFFFGPQDHPGCSKSNTGTLFVSNDPGRGLSGEFTSNGVGLTFTDTMACPTPTPPQQPPTITNLSSTSGACQGTNTMILRE